MERIIVGYDGSEQAKRALERAADLAGANGRVVVLTAVPLLYPTRRAGDLLDPSEEEEATKLLEEARALVQVRGVVSHTRKAAGDPGDALAEAAEELDAELVVVGTRGRGRAARLLLGSVSTKVAQRAPCDVLVVR